MIKIPKNSFAVESGLIVESAGRKSSPSAVHSFEFFDFSVLEYSQKKLFSDFMSPLSVQHHSIDGSHQDENKSSALSDEKNENLLSQVMHQLQERKIRLQYLQKRFG